MKSACLTLLLLFGFFTDHIQSQTPYWQWAKNGEGPGYGWSNAICTDLNGNVYVTGYFDSSSITFGNETLLNAGGDDAFIVKYNSSGNVIWAKSVGGSANEWGSGVCTDANGNVYLTGSFRSPSITLGTDTLLNTGDFTTFLVRYDSSGHTIWAKSTGGTGIDVVSGISMDTNRNVYITGNFTSPYVTFGTDTLINTGNENIFTAKYDPSGHVLWAKSSKGEGNGIASGISTDAIGNTYITGYFSSSGGTSIDTIIFGNDTLVSTVSQNIFIIKYDPSGNVIWAKSSGGQCANLSNGICTDTNSNVYVTGFFGNINAIGFDTITFGNDTLTDADGNHAFIIKYGPSGNVIWAQNVGGSGDVRSNSLSTDADGNIYVTGFFGSFTIAFGNITLTTTGAQDVFVVKYDTLGNVIWAQSGSGSADDQGSAICTDTKGNAYVTGNFNSAISFGDDTLAYAGNQNVFVAKIAYYPLGIAAISNTSHITVYPNPSGSIFYFGGLASGSIIEVYDLLGQRVNTSSPQPLCQGEGLNSQYNVVDLAGRTTGIYFYRITDQGHTIQQGKLMLE